MVLNCTKSAACTFAMLRWLCVFPKRICTLGDTTENQKTKRENQQGPKSSKSAKFRMQISGEVFFPRQISDADFRGVFFSHRFQSGARKMRRGVLENFENGFFGELEKGLF